jgi:hypothetical protein
MAYESHRIYKIFDQQENACAHAGSNAPSTNFISKALAEQE